MRTGSFPPIPLPHGDTVSPIIFGFVQRRIGVGNHGIEVQRARLPLFSCEFRDSKAHSNPYALIPIQYFCIRTDPADPLQRHRRIPTRGVREQKNEFLSPKTCHDIRSAQGFLKKGRYPPQDLIPRQVAIVVIHRFEMIYIGHAQGQRERVPCGKLHFLDCGLQKMAAVP